MSIESTPPSATPSKFAISSWAIRHPTPVLLLFVMLSLLGIYSYLKLPVTGNPKIEFPIVSVSLALPGAQPQELEQNVALKLENALSGLVGIRHLSTTIADGAVDVTVEFVLEADLDRSVADVREAIARVRPELPQAIGEPLVTRVDVSGGALLAYVVRAPTLNPLALQKLIDDQLKPVLLAVPGVQQVRRVGGAQRELRVELIPEKLSALGLSVQEVLRQLRSSEQNLPAGTVRRGDATVALRVLSASENVRSLAARQIALGGNRESQRVRLDSIAQVLDGPSTANTFALLDGEPVLIFEVYKTRGGSELEMADGVALALERFRQDHQAVDFELYYDGAQSTRDSFHGARDTLIEGTFLTILVVLLFLRDWRATAVAAMAIPLSLLPTFAAMYTMGFYLDQVSLLALILVIGILVDDAIVEVENIERRIQAGQAPYRAALLGADEIGLAVLAITLVIVAVFLPVSFIKGVVGKYFVEFGLTTTAAVLSSLVVARLVTPLMCAHWLKAKSHHAPSVGVLQLAYERWLASVLAHPWRTAAVTVVILLTSVSLLTLIPTGFLPKTRGNSITIDYQLPPGSAMHRVVGVAEQMRSALAKVPDIEHVFVSDSGGSGGSIRVVLVPAKQRQHSRERTVELIRRANAELVDVRSNLLLTDDGKEFRLDFESTDGVALDRFIESLSEEAAKLDIFRDVEHSRGNLQPVVDVRPQHDEMARLGVSAEELGTALSVATLSELDALLTRIPIDGELVPIRVRLAGGQRQDARRIADLPIVTSSGSTVPLSSLATLSNASTPSRIDRLDRKRTLSISANLNGVTIGEAEAAIKKLATYQKKPSSVQVANYGDSAYMDEMFIGFAVAMGLGLLAVYAVLVLLFQDWLQPLTIMAALPLALGGAALALLVTGHSLNLSTMIGILMLFGIVAKNSILLVDFIVEARKAGSSRQQAIFKASRERARPIVMTTLAMIGGMLPAAIGVGTDDGFRAPMAVVVIGGLIASTFLSLLLVPWIYTVLDDFKQFLSRRLFPGHPDAVSRGVIGEHHV
jgi:multidrug efflux pump subunit AcrB